MEELEIAILSLYFLYFYFLLQTFVKSIYPTDNFILSFVADQWEMTFLGGIY